MKLINRIRQNIGWFIFSFFYRKHAKLPVGGNQAWFQVDTTWLNPDNLLCNDSSVIDIELMHQHSPTSFQDIERTKLLKSLIKKYANKSKGNTPREQEEFVYTMM